MPEEKTIIESKIEGIESRLGFIESHLDELAKTDDSIKTSFDISVTQIKVELAKISSILEDIKIIIYGRPEFDLQGINEKIRSLNSDLDNNTKQIKDLYDQKESLVATLKGIKIGLTITALTGVGTIGTVISQIFG